MKPITTTETQNCGRKLHIATESTAKEHSNSGGYKLVVGETMDDFLRRLLEMLRSGHFEIDLDDMDDYGVGMNGFGYGMNGFDNLPHFNSKNVRRMITISVAEDDKEAIEKAIKTLQQILEQAEDSEDEEATFGDSFIEEWE